MTTYFDDIGKELDELKRKFGGSEYSMECADALDAIEHRLVADVSICTMCPGFPEDLIEPIDKIIVTMGVATLPHGMVTPERNDFECSDDHRRAIVSLASALHSAFHAVGSYGIPGFTDNPTAPVRVLLLGAAQDRQEALARSRGIGTFRPADDDESIAPEPTT